jgi:hypothetical protein
MSITPYLRGQYFDPEAIEPLRRRPPLLLDFFRILLIDAH